MEAVHQSFLTEFFCLILHSIFFCDVGSVVCSTIQEAHFSLVKFWGFCWQLLFRYEFCGSHPRYMMLHLFLFWSLKAQYSINFYWLIFFRPKSDVSLLSRLSLSCKFPINPLNIFRPRGFLEIKLWISIGQFSDKEGDRGFTREQQMFFKRPGLMG